MRPLLAMALLLLAGCALPDGDTSHLPDGIAVLGDSISRAMNVGDEFGDRPAHNWATGTNASDVVESHYERLRMLDPALDIVAFNDARSGATMADLQRQAEEAVRQRAQYVTILVGANDACAARPTTAETFAAQLRAAADKLAPLGAAVLVASVPDVTQLVALYGENDTARAVWRAFDVCPGVLREGADVDAARARIVAYNEALREEALARGWTWDRGATFDTVYEAGDVSPLDFFHPSLAGQARLAEVTWRAGPYAQWPSSTT